MICGSAVSSQRCRTAASQFEPQQNHRQKQCGKDHFKPPQGRIGQLCNAVQSFGNAIGKHPRKSPMDHFNGHAVRRWF
jgi:hypothetical protein